MTRRPAVTVPHGSEAPLLAVRGLTTQFDTPNGVVQAVSDVSLSVEHGHILGVVGESGSGKSVTARSIMRLVRPPGRIAAGEVVFEGRDLLRLSQPEMRAVRGRRIAMVFQDPQSVLNPVLPVGTQVAEALTVHGVARRQARARAVELLDLVGIPDAHRRAGDYPHQFSGGMRQRVVIATALANEPTLLIADEPTTALDVTIQAQILRLLARLRAELGVAVMMITHDMGVVAQLCNDVVVMYGGRIVERSPAAELFARPRHPYTEDLLRAMPRMRGETTARLPAIPGAPPDPAHLPVGCAFHARCRLAEARCAEQLPELEQVGVNHVAACWVPHDRRPAPLVHAGDAADVRTAGPANEGSPVLQVTGLRVNVAAGRGFGRRPAPVYAVDGVSLTIHAGQTLGLVGESGCGKSTLARAIVGINRPASGDIAVRGKPLRQEKDWAAIRGSIQYIFQDPYASLNPRRTIRQSLDEALRTRMQDGGERRQQVLQLMDRVGLHPRQLDDYPGAFSGGQRQRIGIARALAIRPDLVICDEPVSALDVSIQAQIINLLAELRDQFGLAYLFISHDLAVVRHLSDRVAVMYLGKIVEEGPAEEVYARAQHPYTVALQSASPEPHVQSRQREGIVLQGDLPSPRQPPSGCRFRTRCPIGPLTHPDRQVCVEVEPALRTGGHHAVACHFPGQLDLALSETPAADPSAATDNARSG